MKLRLAIIVALLLLAMTQLRAALPASDTFTRADSGTLGANWTDQVAGMSIVSNIARGAGGVRAGSYWNADSFGNDQYSEITLAASSTNVRTWAFVRMTAAAATLNGMGLDLDSVAGEVRLYKFVTDTPTQLGTFSGSFTWTATDVWRLSVTGTSYSCTQNGVAVGSPVSDSTYSSGSAGIGGDDVGTFIDAWGGGNVAAGGATAHPLLLLGVGH